MNIIGKEELLFFTWSFSMDDFVVFAVGLFCFILWPIHLSNIHFTRSVVFPSVHGIYIKLKIAMRKSRHLCLISKIKTKE